MRKMFELTAEVGVLNVPQDDAPRVLAENVGRLRDYEQAEFLCLLADALDRPDYLGKLAARLSGWRSAHDDEALTNFIAALNTTGEQ